MVLLFHFFNHVRVNFMVNGFPRDNNIFHRMHAMVSKINFPWKNANGAVTAHDRIFANSFSYLGQMEKNIHPDE